MIIAQIENDEISSAPRMPSFCTFEEEGGVRTPNHLLTFNKYQLYFFRVLKGTFTKFNKLIISQCQKKIYKYGATLLSCHHGY